MTGIEALQAMEDGKKVRSTLWAEDRYIHWDKERGHIFSERGEWCKNVDAFMGNVEWEIYEETTTLRELLGCTIRLNGRNYYVVPYILQRTHLNNEITTEVALMPVDRVSGPLPWIYLSLYHVVPIKDILKNPADNGIAILDGE